MVIKLGFQEQWEQRNSALHGLGINQYNVLATSLQRAWARFDPLDLNTMNY